MVCQNAGSLIIGGSILNSNLKVETVSFKVGTLSKSLRNTEQKYSQIIPFENKFKLIEKIRWCNDKEAFSNAISNHKVGSSNRCLNHFYPNDALLHSASCQDGNITTI